MDKTKKNLRLNSVVCGVLTVHPFAYHLLATSSFLQPQDGQVVPVNHHQSLLITGWWFQPLWIIWKSDWIISPTIGENKQCSRAPTSSYLVNAAAGCGCWHHLWWACRIESFSCCDRDLEHPRLLLILEVIGLPIFGFKCCNPSDRTHFKGNWCSHIKPKVFSENCRMTGPFSTEILMHKPAFLEDRFSFWDRNLEHPCYSKGAPKLHGSNFVFSWPRWWKCLDMEGQYHFRPSPPISS